MFRSIIVAEAMVATLDRQGIEKAMGEAWIARFLKFSKRSAFAKTTVHTGAVRLAARECGISPEQRLKGVIDLLLPTAAFSRSRARLILQGRAGSRQSFVVTSAFNEFNALGQSW